MHTQMRIYDVDIWDTKNVWNSYFVYFYPSEEFLQIFKYPTLFLQ